MSASAPSAAVLLRALKLPGFLRAYAPVAEQAEREGWGFERYLHHLAEIEIEDRRGRRIERLLRHSGLPQDKRLSTLDLPRLPASIRRSVPTRVREASSTGPRICSPSACRDAARPTWSAPSVTSSSSAATRCSSCPPSNSYNVC